MMKKATAFISVFVFLQTGSFAQTNTTNSTSIGTNTFCFPVGEVLIYDLYWGIIPVGTAEISSEMVETNGAKFLVLKAKAKTNYVVAKLYPVDDYVESTVDPATFLPVRYTQRLREGRHKRDDEIVFDHKKKTAHWEKAGGTNKMDIAINEDTRDVLSLYYFARSKPYKKGEKEKFAVVVDNKLYDLDLDGIGEENMSVGDYGKMKCMQVEPKAKFGAIFVRKGKVNLWFSSDKRQVCVRMVGKVPVANVRAVLAEVSGPGDDLWVKKDTEGSKPADK